MVVLGPTLETDRLLLRPPCAEDFGAWAAFMADPVDVGTLARLPAIVASRSLMSAIAKAQINPEFGAATVLVLFPDWCVQCRKMMKTLTAFVVANREVPIHAYGLMFPDESVTGVQPLPEAKLKEMQGTATLLVPAETAADFAALDYPLGIVVDKAGLIRFIGVVPGDAFNGDGYIEKVITRMMAKTIGLPQTE